MPLKIKTKAVKEIPAYNERPETDAVKPIKKTKAELLEELEEANKKALELEDELKERAKREGLQKAADAMALIRDSYINAGFTREEAIQLLCSSIKAGRLRIHETH